MEPVIAGSAECKFESFKGNCFNSRSRHHEMCMRNTDIGCDTVEHYPVVVVSTQFLPGHWVESDTQVKLLHPLLRNQFPALVFRFLFRLRPGNSCREQALVLSLRFG